MNEIKKIWKFNGILVNPDVFYVFQSKLKSVEFHPTAQVILTAGMNYTLSLFQVQY